MHLVIEVIIDLCKSSVCGERYKSQTEENLTIQLRLGWESLNVLVTLVRFLKIRELD